MPARGKGVLGENSSPELAPRLHGTEPSRGAAASSAEMEQGGFISFKILSCSKRSLLVERRKHIMVVPIGQDSR